jgi:hypothetical protein
MKADEGRTRTSRVQMLAAASGLLTGRVPVTYQLNAL